MVLALLVSGYGVAARVYSEPWAFGYNLGGYYNRLTRAFLEGHLYLDVEPRPELLSSPNPWDPALPDEWRLHDAVLFNKRYYLYHGIAPVLVLLAPFRYAAGWDLPEPVAVWIFLTLGCAWQMATLSRWRPLTVWDAVALGLGGGTLFLLHRVFVYEVAIACGYACVALAIWAAVRQHWTLAGLGVGLALLARPHLALVLLPLLWQARQGGWRRLLAPVLLCGIVLGWYNWARFGVPWEFGLRYLLSGAGQQSLHLSWAAVGPSLWLLLAEPLDWPTFRLRQQPLVSTAGLAMREFTLGALWLCPVLLGPWRWRSATAVFGLLSLGFLCTTGWVTQRYSVDFLPWLLLAALGSSEPAPWRKALILIGALTNVWLWRLGPFNGQ